MREQCEIRACVIFDNLGPYHLARLGAGSRLLDVTAIQVCCKSADYAWDNDTANTPFGIATLFQADMHRTMQNDSIQRAMEESLDRLQPSVVFIPGWSGKAAFSALSWCIRHRVPVVAMSESTEWDEPRKPWREWVKHQVVGLSAAALVGGQPHADYMVKLGMPRERVFLGYDAVDNHYFATQSEHLKCQQASMRAKYDLPSNYFLASARFVEKKNLLRLIKAYVLYRKIAERSKMAGQQAKPWELVLLGDGPLRGELTAASRRLEASQWIHLPGFKQYRDLPAYYGLAGAFVHASSTEQWGLVVNEAMASGLPVLVSNRCGCAMDLVTDGVNGYTFNPYNVEQLADLMLKISAPSFPLSAYGEESQRIVSNWGTDRFAAGLEAAAERALNVGPARASLVQRLLLRGLLFR